MSLDNPSTPSFGITAEKPVPILTKPIKVDFAGVFKALSKATVNVATTHFDRLGSDLVDATFALGLKTTPEELAYSLVHRSLMRAVLDLIGESITLIASISLKSTKYLETAFSATVDRSTFKITHHFFRSPRSFELLDDCTTLLKTWLIIHGLSERDAETVSLRLPTYFVLAVHRELGRQQRYYEPLISMLETPVGKAVECEFAWQRYAATLSRQTDESIFDDLFGLRQIYVTLRAAMVSNINPNVEDWEGRFLLQSSGKSSEEIAKAEYSWQQMERRKKVVVMVGDELLYWLTQTDRINPIRALSGGPGSGKSAFAKMFASTVASMGKFTLLIPLHLIDPSQDVHDEVRRFAMDDNVLGFDPLEGENASNELLIIFDGLDELAGQGVKGNNAARLFIQAVERFVDRRNHQRLRLRVLFCGREVVIQENEIFFQQPTQLLELLPYYLSAKEQHQLRGDKHIISHDYRNDWWINYGKLVGTNYVELPKELKKDVFLDVTTQPLLNHLIALLAKENFKSVEAANRNKVYSELVRRVYERGYERGRIYPLTRHLSFEKFCRVLEEIGLAAWHGDRRSATVKEIRERCKESRIEPLLEVFQESAEKGVTRLLSAFFFRRYAERASGEPTFIFTHKSFGEYLTARRIVLCLKTIVQNLTDQDEYGASMTDEQSALETWCKICGPNSFDLYLTDSVRQEVALEDVSIVSEWQKTLARLFTAMLRHGMPMERLRLHSFHDATRQSRNAEEALLIVMNSCALHTKQLSQVDYLTSVSLRNWLRRIQQQGENVSAGLCTECLSYLSVSGCVLDLQDLYGADLSHSEISRAKINYCALETDQFIAGCLRKVEFARLQVENLFSPKKDYKRSPDKE